MSASDNVTPSVDRVDIETISRNLRDLNRGLQELGAQIKRANAIVRAAKADPEFVLRGDETELQAITAECDRLRRFYVDEFETIKELDQSLVTILRTAGSNDGG